METHSSHIFQFDKDKTKKGYEVHERDQSFDNEIWEECLNTIIEMKARQDLELGIDFSKPWEQIENKDFYQIEYLFVGRLIDLNKHITDPTIGINLYAEKNFGQEEFGTNSILNLTLIKNKN